MAGAMKFRQVNTPRQMGELARIKIVQGPDYGVIFVITQPDVSIGRGDTNDIMLSDLKSSRIHARITYEKGAWHIRDQGSSNGIFYNGRMIRDTALKGSEVLTVGETTFEFLLSRNAGTQMLVAPPRSMDQIKAERAVYVQQVRRARGQESVVIAGSGGAGATTMIGRLLLNKKFILPFFAVMVAMIVMEDGGDATKGKKKKKDSNPGALGTSRIQGLENPAAAAAAEMFFKAGFREFRERNYLRAKQQFEMVLQVAPSHELANLYLSNCDHEIDDEIQRLLATGRRSFESGKYKEAKGSFEAVLRLKHRETETAQYKEASELREKTLRVLRGELPEPLRAPAAERPTGKGGSN